MTTIAIMLIVMTVMMIMMKMIIMMVELAPLRVHDTSCLMKTVIVILPVTCDMSDDSHWLG